LGCGKRSNSKEGWAIGHAHAEGWLKADPKIRLCGVDISPENLAAFGERFKLPREQLFASTDALYEALKPDYVSVCTWPALHMPMTVEAAERGVRGVVCEKPMALDIDEMRQMRDACAKRGTRLAIAHQRCYEPMYRLARKLIQSGAVGERLVLEARVGDDWDILSWSVHWFDMARFLFDAKPVRVLAGGDVTGARRYQHAVENWSNIYVEYSGGQQATFITGPSHQYGLWVRGSRGMIEISDRIRLWNEQGYSEPAVEATNFAGGFAALMSEMLTDGPMLCGVENTYSATELAYAAHESIRTRRTVSLPSTTLFAPLEILAHPSEGPAIGNVVVVADKHHCDPESNQSGREGLVTALQALKPKSVSLVDSDERSLEPADLNSADLLVLYHTRRQSTPGARQAIERWVKAGKPMAVVHCGIGAYSDWPEFRKWIGNYWVWGDEAGPVKSGHPHEPCTIKVLDPKWNIPWTRAWLPKDEVYINLGQAADVRMLAIARRGEQTSPAAWQSIQYPNIVVWIPGHRADIWELDMMRDGLLATIRLASGL
jgi:predicted dehydrogenase